MRNFLLAGFLLAVVSVLTFIPAPVGPSAAFALDDPALADGGAFCAPQDGGLTATCDTGRTSSWNMAIRCEGGQPCRYKMCEFATGTDPSTCSATAINQFLEPDRTFDVAVPNNRRFISVTAADGGAPNANIQIVTP